MCDLNQNIPPWLLTLKVDNPCSSWLFLLIHLYLSNAWLGVCLQEQIPKYMCLKEIGLDAQNMITIVSPMVNIIRGGGAI